jgi:cytochrome c biogenesis protein CcdA
MPPVPREVGTRCKWQMKQSGLISVMLLGTWFIVVGTGFELRKIFPAWYDFISLASGLLVIALSWYIVERFQK